MSVQSTSASPDASGTAAQSGTTDETVPDGAGESVDTSTGSGSVGSADSSATGPTDVGSPEEGVDPGPSGTRAQRTSAEASDPEREGDIAADYLEELLDIADLDGDIDLDVEGDRAIVSLVGGDLDVLVGRDGIVLEALQDLTRLAVLRSTNHRSRLLLDVAGWRGRQREQLRERATAAVETARSTGEPVALAPMSSYERKIVHDLVAELGLLSASEGDDPDRHVVVRTA